MSQDYIYSAGLDADPLYAELNKINAAMNNLGKQGADALNRIENEAKQAGGAVSQMGNQAGQLRQQFGQLGGVLQQIGGNTSIGQLGMAIGVVSGGVAALTTKLIEMAAQAVQSFNAVYNQAIEMNQEVESAQYLFSNLFGGDMDKAGVLVGDLKELGQVLGLNNKDVFQFSKAAAPDAETVGDLKELIVLADRFNDLENPQGGFSQLSFSFNEMLAGDFTSAKEILNLSKGTIDNIKEAQKEYGNFKGVIIGLTEYLETRGLGTSSLDAMAGSAQGAQKSVEGLKSEFINALGVAPFEAYKESTQIFATFLQENREPIIEIAYAIGDILAAFTRLGTEIKEAFSGNVDMESVAESFRELADNITAVTIQAETLAENISGFGDIFGGLWESASSVFDAFKEAPDDINRAKEATDLWAQGMESVGEFFEGGIITKLGKLNEAMVTLNQIVALVKAGWAGIAASIAPIFDDIRLIGESFQALWEGDFDKLKEIDAQLQASFEARGGSLIDKQAGLEAVNASLAESVKAMEAAEEKYKSYQETVNERSTSGNESLSDEEELPGAVGKDQESEEVVKARDKINKKLEDIEVDHFRKLSDIQDDAYEKMLDAQQDFAEKREDIERDYQQNVEDINRKYSQQIAAAKDFSDEERKIATEQQRELVNLDRETAQRRQDIEKDYQRQIQDIQRQFQMDAEDAARNQDAIAFLRAQENRDRSLEDAQIDRDQKQTDAATEAQRQREELLVQQQQELEDARLANQQKIEELKLRLQQELEEARIKYERDLENQAIAEQRKTQALNEQIEQRVQKELQANQRRLEDLQRTLAKEIELVAQAEAKKAQLRAASAASTPWSQQSSTVTNRNRLTGLEGISGRALGGTVMKNQPYIVGEEGPELYVPQGTGRIIPNNRLMYSPTAPGGGGTTVYNQQQANLSMLDPTQVGPAQRAAMRQDALTLLAELT